MFFDIEKAYDKINRDKTFEELENIEIQGRVMEFIRELVSYKYIKVRVGESTVHQLRCMDSRKRTYLLLPTRLPPMEGHKNKIQHPR